MNFSLVVTGWLPYFQKLHLLSTQEEDEWAKSLLPWDLGFTFGEEAGRGEHANSPEPASHWLKLTGLCRLGGRAFGCAPSEDRA